MTAKVMKEYGGYFPLDLGYMGRMNNEPFKDIAEKDKMRFNAARYAICYAVQEGHYDKIYIPLYMCESISVALEQNGIPYEFYHIDDRFFPCIDAIEQNACILICNFFGIYGYEKYTQSIKKYENVIFDNTQAFYMNPILTENVYYVYSPRKFVGVSDGAYLIKKNLKKQSIPQSESYQTSGQLLKSIEGGTNYGYDLYLSSEQQLEKNGIQEMSSLTLRLLSCIDYEEIKKRRKQNFHILADQLSPYNEIDISEDADLYPMVYPFMMKQNGLRDRLVRNKVYVPQWWKWVLSNEQANAFEKDAARYLIPLPVDHRYDAEDMYAIAQIVLMSAE